MKRIILVLVAMFSLNTYSQSLKLFNGTFNDGKSQNGTAVYNYYEDSLSHEYLKQGPFKYSFVGQADYKGYNQIITGNYEKGLKHGLWTYTIGMADFGYNNPYFTGKITLTANYKNGYADGNWKEVRSLKSRKKILMYGQYSWSEFEPIKNMIIDINFKNGKLIGVVNVNDEFSKFKLNGVFDNNSYLMGTWLINDMAWNDNLVVTFKDNYFFETIVRNNNGEVTGTENNQKDYDLFVKSKNMSDSEKEETGIVIDINSGLKYLNPYFSKLFEKEYFLSDYLGGDLTFNVGAFVGGWGFKLREIKYYPIRNNQDFIQAEEYFKTKNYFEAYKYYQRALQSNVSTRPSEKKLIDDTISLMKPQIDLTINKYGSNKSYFDEYLRTEFDSLERDIVYFSRVLRVGTRIDEYVKKTESSEYIKYRGVDVNGKIKEVVYCNCNYNDKRGVNKEEIILNPWLALKWDDLKDCFEKNKGLYNIIQIAITEQYFNYLELLKKEERNILKTRIDFDYGSRNFDFYRYDKEIFQNNISNVKQQYDLSKSFIRYNKDIEKLKSKVDLLNSTNSKVVLYSKFQIVYNDFLQKKFNYIDFQTTFNTLNSTFLFLEKIVSLYSVDTSEIENRLNTVATSAEQIKSIIFE